MDSKPSIGLQLYGIREECKKNLQKTLETVAKMGFQGVEFHDTYGFKIPQLRRFLDDAGLSCCGFHVRPFEKMVGAALEETVEFHNLLGNPYVIVPGLLPDRFRTDMSELRKVVDLLTEAALHLSAYGISVGYHNANTEFYSFDGGIFWELLVGMLPTSIFIQLDTGNAAVAKADIMECLERSTRRLTTIHAKAFSRKQPEALIGEDELPWTNIIKFCKTKGRTEWFILEYEKNLYQPLIGTEKTFINFQKILDENT